MGSLTISREYFPEVVNPEYRKSLSRLSLYIQESEHSFAPRTEHVFADGTYTRAMYLSAGETVVGKVHRRACINILAEGTVIITSDEHGPVEIEAPNWFVSGAQVAKAIYAVTDCVLLNVIPNPTNTRDVKALEDWWTHSDYELPLMLEEDK